MKRTLDFETSAQKMLQAFFVQDPHPTSDIRHPTSDIRHPTSDIRQLYTACNYHVNYLINSILYVALFLVKNCQVALKLFTPTPERAAPQSELVPKFMYVYVSRLWLETLYYLLDISAANSLPQKAPIGKRMLRKIVRACVGCVQRRGSAYTATLHFCLGAAQHRF